MLQLTTADSPSSKYAGSTARGSAVRLYVMASAAPPVVPVEPASVDGALVSPPLLQPAKLTRPKPAADTPSISMNVRLLNVLFSIGRCLLPSHPVVFAGPSCESCDSADARTRRCVPSVSAYFSPIKQHLVEFVP